MADASREPAPLKPRTLLILMALAAGSSHGYAIKKDIEERTGGSVQIDPGTLYRLLGRLLERGLIEESDERPDPEGDDPRRRYYRLTGSGRAALEAEIERMEDLVAEARPLLSQLRGAR